MSIELIAILIVIVTVVAIAGKKKKKKSAKTFMPPIQGKTETETQTSTTGSVSTPHDFFTGKMPVIINGNGKKKEGVMELQKQGLRVYDKDGNIMLDATSRLTKYLGTLSIGTTDGSYTDNRLQEGEFWWVTLRLNDYKKCYGMKNQFTEFLPEITRQGTVITWKYTNQDTTYRTGLTIVYGVY